VTRLIGTCDNCHRSDTTLSRTLVLGLWLCQACYKERSDYGFKDGVDCGWYVRNVEEWEKKKGLRK